jgi:ABC-type transporter Mla MlaB component
MLTFFRKNKGGSKSAAPDSGRKAAVPVLAAEPAMPADARTPGHGVQVLELDIQLVPEVWDAVMHYANGHVNEAIASLQRCLANHPDSPDPQPWRLLFDIYEANDMRQPFEELAMSFAMRFERSPRTWRPMPKQAATVAESSNRSAIHAFEPKPTPETAETLARFVKEARSADDILLDFSHLPVPEDEVYADQIIDVLTRLSVLAREIHLIGGEAFATRLNAHRHLGHLNNSGWLLLLMLLQLLKRPDEFDAAALDYAVLFEISPPSYAPPKCQARSEPVSQSQFSPTGQTFAFSGQITTSAMPALEALRALAAPLPSLEINLGAVSRIDFSVVGVLVDAVMDMAEAGKTITITEGSEIVCLLLQMVGLGQFASIQPTIRK